MKMIFYTVYRLPDSKTNNFKEIIDSILKSIDDQKDKYNNIVICGDFNLPFISWPNGSFEERGISKAAGKIQAGMLLGLAESLFHRKSNQGFVHIRSIFH